MTNVAAFEVKTGDPGYLSTIGPQVMQFAIERGVVICPLGETIYIMPAHCISENKLDRI